MVFYIDELESSYYAGLSGGAVAGIVIAMLVLVIGGIVLAMFILIKRYCGKYKRWQRYESV